jgi:hypothetical protein
MIKDLIGFVEHEFPFNRLFLRLRQEEPDDVVTIMG